MLEYTFCLLIYKVKVWLRGLEYLLAPYHKLLAFYCANYGASL